MNRQKGISLISLMIGLLVSMIVLIGMMMVFRNTIQTVAPASEGARSDGERISGLLAAHMMLQDAGFGVMDASPGTHLRVLAGATRSGGSISGGSLASSGQPGNAVIWIKQMEDDELCEALFADGDGGLWRISSSNTSCSSISSGITGEAAPLILPSRHPDDEIAEITITATELTTGNECRPFGIGTNILGTIAVTLTVQTPTTLALGGDIQSTTCMVNFLP